MTQDQSVRLICGAISAINSYRQQTCRAMLLISQEEIGQAAEHLKYTQVMGVLAELVGGPGAVFKEPTRVERT